jgi:hypothetical protein
MPFLLRYSSFIYPKILAPCMVRGKMVILSSITNDWIAYVAYPPKLSCMVLCGNQGWPRRWDLNDKHAKACFYYHLKIYPRFSNSPPRARGVKMPEPPFLLASVLKQM